MLLVDATMQAKDVMKILLEKYEVQDIDAVLGFFGLFESKNGSSIDLALQLDTEVADVVNGWTDENSKLVFMIRLFMPCMWGLEHKDIVASNLSKPKELLSMEAYLENASVVDSNILHLQYIQAVYHVITGQYPTTQEQALILGSLHFLYKFGEYSSEKHQAGFLGNRIVEFIPFRYLKKKSLEDWETILFSTLLENQNVLLSLSTSDENQTSNTNTNTSAHSQPAALGAQHKYMDYIFRLPNSLFGCTFFKCHCDTQKNIPDTVIIGLHTGGINLFDKSSDRKLIKHFGIEDIYRWGYNPNEMFYFEIKPNNTYDSTIRVKTKDGQKMSDLLTDYALAYIKERDREEERAKTMDTISVEDYNRRVVKWIIKLSPHWAPMWVFMMNLLEISMAMELL